MFRVKAVFWKIIDPLGLISRAHSFVTATSVPNKNLEIFTLVRFFRRRRSFGRDEALNSLEGVRYVAYRRNRGRSINFFHRTGTVPVDAYL